MIIITGGAGLIGSALLWRLNSEHGRSDIILVDDIDHDYKERNIAPLQYDQLHSIQGFRDQLREGVYDNKGVTDIIHMGACSATTETDWDYLHDNNTIYSQEIIRWCFDRGVRCIYASSAATYGDGALGFSDNHDLFNQLKPLNLYGQSKLEVDIWARDAGYLSEVVGLRYFNVFGPNEQHKGSMRSVIAKKFEQARDDGVIELFKSGNKEYKDGEQCRDFVYVKDAVDATLYFLQNRQAAGVFNVGTGKARTWNDVANSMFAALGKQPNIKYVDLPADIKNQYQYFTEADISKLRAAGYKQDFTSLEDSIKDYVQNYLLPSVHLGEENISVIPAPYRSTG